MRPMDANEVDIGNRFLVSCNARPEELYLHVMNIRKIALGFSVEDALVLAAWLVALADRSEDHSDFKTILARVEEA